jgi:3-hydroxy-9,10-secoandrosta-1,3,5(10)-triene-9,17-dione monooxygenase
MPGKYQRYGGTVQNPIGADIRLSDVPDSIELIPIQLTAEDGAPSRGLLYHPRGSKPKVGIHLMHPRADLYANYCALPLALAGYEVLAVVSRWPNNDISTIHEKLLLDMAAGIRQLKERGCEQIVLVGNSGGSALGSFYQSQATAPKGERLTQTPAGDAFDLNEFDLSAADGLVLIGPHIGQGGVLSRLIDPSVVDESDPYATDPALDMYNPDNGFVMPPASSKYSAEFLERYRDAQLARLRRLDVKARSLVNRQRDAAAAVQALGSRATTDQIRAALVEPTMVIYRSVANPANVDLSIDPDDRPVRSYHTTRPDLENWDSHSFAHVITPRAWLSTWSGLSTNCKTVENLKKVHEPVLIVQYAADCETRTGDIKNMHAAAASTDKTMHIVRNTGRENARGHQRDARLGEGTFPGLSVSAGPPRAAPSATRLITKGERLIMEENGPAILTPKIGHSDWLGREELDNLTVDEIVRRLVALQPFIAENAPKSEQIRRAVDEVWSAVRRTGVFYLHVPKARGGLEQGLESFIDVILPIGEVDMSLAWTAAFSVMHQFQVVQCSDELQEEVWNRLPYATTAGSAFPPGHGVPVEGGYRISGHIKYVSGVMHSEWLNPFVSIKVNGEKSIYFCWVPMEEVTVLDAWHVDGMSGTGSHDVKFEDIFVPEYRTLRVDALVNGQQDHDNPFYRLPLPPYLSLIVGTTMLGGAKGQIKRFREKIAKPGPDGKIPENPIQHVELARAEMAVRGAEFLIRDAARTAERLVEAGPLDSETRASLRAQMCYAAKLCLDAVRSICDLSGSSAHYLSNPMQRVLRDMNMLATHAAIELTSSLEEYGRLAVGLSGNWWLEKESKKSPKGSTEQNT